MTFQTPASILDRQQHFGHREVGLTHPDLESFIRLADNGDIQIMVGDGVGIVISKIQRTIVLFADQVKFFTKENEGLKWNALAFNAQATKGGEPAFIYSKEDRSIYEDTEYFLGE